MMNKVGLIFLIVTQIIVFQAMAVMALESETPTPMPGLNPLEVKKFNKEVQLSDQKSEKIVDHASLKEEGESKVEDAEAPIIRRLGKHHSTDKSVAGGGVILGGLVTATFAAVFCYIRVTRKRNSDH